MLTKQNIIIAVVVALVLIVAAVLIFGTFWGNTNQDAGSGGGTTALPPAGPYGLPIVPIPASLIPASPTITIGTPKGLVTVNNFYKTALGMDADTMVLAYDPSYEITYDRASSAFSVTLTDTSSADVRNSAEQKFLEITGTSKEQACKLDTALSFCLVQ